MRGITIENEETDGENFEFFGIFPVLIITLVLKAAKQPLTTARSAGEIKA